MSLISLFSQDRETNQLGPDTEVLKRQKKQKRAMWVNYKKTGLEANKLLNDLEVKILKNTIAQAKAHYKEKLVSQIQTDPKRFWNYAKHFSKSSASVEVLLQNDIKITDDTQTANNLNDFFISVLTQEEIPETSLPKLTNPYHILTNYHITLEMVQKKLNKLKPNKASGPIEISVNVLRNCTNFAAPLSITFNKSLQTGHVPQDWKYANVTPLFKKGSRTQCNNYRLVSLTSQVIKILERLIYDKLTDLTTFNKLMDKNQHGFQDSCSCITQLLECFNYWMLNYDEGLKSDIVYFDFAKAFDMVPHCRHVHKLGVRGQILHWIHNFLTGCCQLVILRNSRSFWKKVTSGAPQGSILGPILFLIYVNYIPNAIKTNVKMFTDDTKIYNSISSISGCQALQGDLNMLGAWSQNWLLKFNALKCVVLKTEQNHNFHYLLNGTFLSKAEDQRDLGVIVSNNVNPRKHI